MKTALEMLEEHENMMRLLRSGGKIPCPNCEDGHISRISEGAYICDKCGKGMIGRVNIDLPS